MRKHTSSQQCCAAAGQGFPRRRRRPSAPLGLLDGQWETSGSGRIGHVAPAPIVINQTKLAIVAVMQELDCPVTSTELQSMWAEHKALKIFEYHLSTLATAKVVEVVYGPELHFRLVGREQTGELSDRERRH